MFSSLVKLLKALNSEQGSSQLAMAISLAAILGLTPLYSLHNFFVIFIAFSFRVNLSLLFLSYPLFALIGYLLSGLFESVGLTILQHSSLVDLWQSFFNTLIGRWSAFYYSGVIGSLVISLILAIALYPLSKKIVDLYRIKLMKKIEKIKFIQMLKASSFWALYEKA